MAIKWCLIEVQILLITRHIVHVWGHSCYLFCEFLIIVLSFFLLICRNSLYHYIFWFHYIWNPSYVIHTFKCNIPSPSLRLLFFLLMWLLLYKALISFYSIYQSFLFLWKLLLLLNQTYSSIFSLKDLKFLLFIFRSHFKEVTPVTVSELIKQSKFSSVLETPDPWEVGGKL